MKQILVKFPSRSRPQKLISALDNIYEMCDSRDDIFIQLTLDVDDSTCNTPQIRDKINSYGKNILAYWGFSKGKIDSCNRDKEFFPPFDIIILMSDDFVFLEKGFDSVIRSDFETYFPDMDGVLHYPDGSPASDNLITLSIIGATYFNRFGYLYNAAYISVYADNELTEVAKRLKKYKHINRNLFYHAHPIWKKAEWDDLYRKNEDQIFYKQDRETFFKRQAINFGL